jgi:hypothetical protein
VHAEPIFQYRLYQNPRYDITKPMAARVKRALGLGSVDRHREDSGATMLLDRGAGIFTVTFRDSHAGDFPEILALTAESVRFISPLDEALLAHLHYQSAYHRVVAVGGTAVTLRRHCTPTCSISRAGKPWRP